MSLQSSGDLADEGPGGIVADLAFEARNKAERRTEA